MSSELQTAIISSLITFIGTLFITLLALRLQRGRKIIQYNIASMPLLRFKPMEGTLSISVDKFILTNEESDKGTSQPITNTYGFQIDLFNTGSEDIENPNVEITLDSSAKIVGYETQPTNRPGYEIKIQRDNSQPNILRVLVPFINRGEQVTIRLISTDNVTKQCKVDVLGLGIHAHIRHSDRNYFLSTLLPLIVAMIILIIIVTLPDSAIIYMGGHYIKSNKAFYPDWVYIPTTIILIGAFLITLLNILRRAIRTAKRHEIEWEEKEVKQDLLTLLRKLFS